MNEETVVFLHVPKTAGTTLIGLLDAQYPGRTDHLYGMTEDQIIMNLYADRSMPRCVRGHFQFGIHRRLTGPFTYVTILREPVDHMISLYSYLLESSGGFEQCDSLEEFVTSNHPDYYWRTFNLQTMYLSGKIPPDLSVAKANLRRYFSVVGLMDRFAETVFLMGKRLGWSSLDYEVAGVTSRRPRIDEIPPETIRLIENRTRLDRELYEYGKILFEKQLRKLDGPSKERLRGFLASAKGR